MSDNYITKEMIKKESYEGNNFSQDNAVMYDLQNGRTDVICFCSDKHVAKSIAKALNLLDNLEADGVEVKNDTKR